MSLLGRYVVGVTAVGAAGMLALAMAPPGTRAAIAWGLGVGLLLQAPLGWWTLRAVGTERFLGVWGLGMLVRFAVVALAAFALLRIGPEIATPMLATMVGTLMALLLVEGAVAMRTHSREDGR